MENSLFSINENYNNDATANPPPALAQQQQQPDASVLQALLSVSVGRNIMLDTSAGKKDSLLKLAPQSRGLRRLINAIGTGGDSVRVANIDEAIELLDTMDDIVMNKFTVPTPLDV
ncbi:P12 [Betabaculovirus altermyunipunctae]|uniref:P12 n=1 Tax=Betabaculovirus altermyunipunctae TaxID=3051996 RepID=A0A1S5YDZ6_9BBAC|nr:P12 [Betabaculovirus altermyunipunctae]AQQ80353.1 P12 [Betabaculovirus altermyunipunctae]